MISKLGTIRVESCEWETSVVKFITDSDPKSTYVLKVRAKSLSGPLTGH